MSKAATARWKNCEKGVAELLKKYLMPAERIMDRSANFSISCPDVRINGFPEAKIDSKYSIKGFKTSTMLDIVKDKYCEYKRDIPMLFCKGYKEVGYKSTVEGEFFAMLLSYWLGHGTKEELLAIYNKEKPIAAEES